MSEPESERRTAEESRRALLALRGVLAASVEVDDEGVLSRVSVVAQSGEKSRRQIVQDVISLVFVYLGVKLSPSKVDVVFSSGDDDLLQSVAGRPRLVSLESHYGSGGCTVKVGLALEDREVTGTVRIADEKPSSHALLAAGGRATLQASEGFLEGVHLQLQHIDSMEFARERVVMVAVTLTPDIGAGVLVGAVRVRRDLLEASARAALDAINRTFQF